MSTCLKFINRRVNICPSNTGVKGLVDLSEINSALLLKIKTMLPEMRNAERRVASYILDNPNNVISLAVAGLAEASNVSDATVIRTCKTLGFSSYQDLKVSLAVDIVSPIQAIHEEITPEDSSTEIVEKVFKGCMYALECTCSMINTDTIEKVAETINRAQQVLIFGLGNSHPVALDLQHKLMRLGINAQAYADSHFQTIAAVNTSAEDVVFAISHSGSSKDIVDAARLAKENGATVISLTNIGTSPLSKVADYCLFTMSNETKYRIVALTSRIAQMAIIDSIYTLISCHHTQVTENFRKIEHALDDKKY